MLVNLIEISPTRKAVEMVFPAPDVDSALAGAMAEMAPRVRIPGFRPGKAPKSMLMSRMKDDIVKSAAERLIRDCMEEAIRTAGMEPISRPALASAEMTEGSGGTVTVQFDVAPDVQLPDYKDLRLTKKKRIVDDDLVERALEEMRQRAARMVPVEGGAEIGHFVEFDLKYKPQGMKARNNYDRRLCLEAGRPFDAELVGMKVDETKKFSIQVPDDDRDRNVAGKLVQHEVTVTDIRARVVPELNDEFAKDTGRYDSLAALRAGVRKELEESAESEALSRLQGDLLDNLLDAAPFEVPLSMVYLQLDDYCRELADKLVQMGLEGRGMNWQAYRQRRLNDAQRAVRSGYLLQALGNAGDIQVSDEEVDNEIRKWMEASGATDTFEAVKADFDKHGATMEIRGRLRTEKIFDSVLKHVTVTEEMLDGKAYEELLEMERRRAEGLAQARFDAGGLDGGDLDEQDSGAPAAVATATEAVATATEEPEEDTTAKPHAEAEPHHDGKKVPKAAHKHTKDTEDTGEVAAPVAKPAAKAEVKAAPKSAPKLDDAPAKPPAKTAKPAAKITTVPKTSEASPKPAKATPKAPTKATSKADAAPAKSATKAPAKTTTKAAPRTKQGK